MVEAHREIEELRDDWSRVMDRDLRAARPRQAWDWVHDLHGYGYSLEEEMMDQLDMLPEVEHARKLIGMLELKDVQLLAQDVTEAAIFAVTTNSCVDLARNVIGWIETAEELVRGDDQVELMLDRRAQMRSRRAAGEHAEQQE